MKLTSTVVLLAALVASASAHIAMMRPTPRGGYGTKDYNGRVHVYIGFKGQKYPCGGYPRGPVTKMKAGEVIPVLFWTPGITDTKKIPTKKLKPARHGGGFCEFSLSRDGGKSFQVIGSYSYSCPDVYYSWPVRIPRNIPDCKERGKCLFAWSWTAHLVAQFYHNCADVEISGVKKGKWPTKSIQLYNFKPHPRKTFPGDGKSHDKGSGPNQDEMKKNLK
ncbi:hypothetical protein DFQ27_008326 [Actinomortierella ambigua]|uniref:Lytic polysaccharide monooxygenase n=1 Tax=Actinomortierella ambigua TaxID=1343610 RepID=A0A9P6TYW0_9FUNG|nr:hypothetical protein DFQ27_008326 [Actinomortierella ambigua]